VAVQANRGSTAFGTGLIGESRLRSALEALAAIEARVWKEVGSDGMSGFFLFEHP
jgi:hypothetical protein